MHVKHCLTDILTNNFYFLNYVTVCFLTCSLFPNLCKIIHYLYNIVNLSCLLLALLDV